jgi:hypothetical protein
MGFRTEVYIMEHGGGGGVSVDVTWGNMFFLIDILTHWLMQVICRRNRLLRNNYTLDTYPDSLLDIFENDCISNCACGAEWYT